MKTRAEYCKKELILFMEEARNIHQQWVDHQENLRSKGKKAVRNVGGVEWHERWVTIYNDVIIALRK